MAAAETALDTYLQFLDSSVSGNEQEVTEVPHTASEEVLVSSHHHQQQRHVTPAVPHDRTSPPTSYDRRLSELEHQLASLLQRSKGPARTKKSFAAAQDEKENMVSGNVQNHGARTVSEKERGSKPHPVAAGTDRVRMNSPAEDRRQKQRLLSHHHSREGQRAKTTPTIQVLAGELEAEKERRWKAEQAAVKLADHIRTLQSQLEDQQQRVEVSVVKAAHIDKSLEKERELTRTLTQEREKLSEELTQCSHDKDVLQQRCQQHLNSLHTLENTLHQLKSEYVSYKTNMTQQVREADVRRAVTEKEVEMQQSVATQLQEQLRDLQEFLATREKHHQRELAHLQPPCSGDIQQLVDKEVNREKERSEILIIQLREKLDQQQKDYHQLEEEFRMGLRIEAARYHELEKSHQTITAQLATCREAIIGMRERERKTTSLVSELSSIVKEQKRRITELVNTNHKTEQHYKEQVSQLETATSDKNRNEARLTALQEENARLSARVAAQDSVVCGLREERKLWGHELALQGATLAQERGRMEARIESLTGEVNSLKEQHKTARTSLQVKEKVVEDQTNTIRQLRQEVSSKEEEVAGERRKWQDQVELLQAQLEQEQSTSQELQEQFDELMEERRREEETEEELQEQLTQWKEKYNKLHGKWDERVGLIATLEADVSRMQKETAEKVATLMREKEDAFKAARQAQVERLQMSGESFQAKVAEREKAVRDSMQRLLDEKEREIATAHQKVKEVEEEMRQMLTETAREKKSMETKFHKLSKAFQDLHQELS